jgi:splicing factor 3B subunit 3
MNRSRFLAVGLKDSTVRLISLDPSDCLQPLSMQALPGVSASSLCMLEMSDAQGSIAAIYLNIGLENGVFIRTTVDRVSGELSDTRTRYFGSRPVRLYKLKIQDKEAVLALSSRSWLSYIYQGQHRVTPLSYETLDYASAFSSEACPEGIVAVSKNTLRILALEKLGLVFNQVSTSLELTPRKIIANPASNTLILLESEHNAHSKLEKAKILHAAEGSAAGANGVGANMDISADGDASTALAAAAAAEGARLPEEVAGEPYAGRGHWAANIRIVDPLKSETLFLLPLPEKEAALRYVRVRVRVRASVCVCVCE